MKLEDKIPNITKYLKNGYDYIEPDALSNPCLCVPDIVFEYGGALGKVKTLPFIGHYIVGCINQLIKSYKHMHDAPKNPKTHISEDDLDNLKSYIKSLGIDDVGFTQVKNSLIFSNRKIVYQNAIVMIMEMKEDKINTAPSRKASIEIFRTYYNLGVAANKIKEYLNTMGYAAQASPALGGEVHYPSLAQKAGLGAIGKHGLLITPKFGPSIRIAAVYTNIENLPNTDSDAHAWINDFCSMCNRCVKKCPANAIYKDTKTLESGTKEYIDYKKCAVPFANNYGCTVCVKECVFFKGGYDKIHSNYNKNR